MTKAVNLAAVGSNANTGGTLITSGTAQATTSGTFKDFTGIPSTAKRITLMINNFSTAGTSHYQIQLGTISSLEITGYQAVSTYGPNLGTGTITTGFPIYNDGVGNFKSGALIFSLLDATNYIWVCSGTVGQFGASPNYNMPTSGNKTLTGTLDRIRLTTVNGTDTFDAGSINIFWE